MIQTVAEAAPRHEIEKVLRADLARGDAVAESVVPVLRYLLAGAAPDLFNADVLARVRGMAENLSAQLLELRAVTATPGDEAGHKAGGRDEAVQALASALLERSALLAHLHALAIEWRLTERLEARISLDPVMPPWLQSMMGTAASPVPDIATRFLAAQARFCQAQRQMKLPIGELPVALVEDVLHALRGLALDSAATELRIARIEAEILARHDLSPGRQELSARLLLAAGSRQAARALSIGEAGVALFLTALALGSDQSRDALTLATHESQATRLLLALRSAGLDASATAEQFRILNLPKAPSGVLDDLDSARASEILNGDRHDIPLPET